MWSLLTALPLGQPYSDLSLRLSLYIVNKCFSRLRCRGTAADSADRLFNDEDCLLVGVCRSGRLHPGPCRRRRWRRLLSAVRCVSPSFHPPFSLLQYDSQPWSLIPSTFLFAPVWQPTRRIPHSIHLSLLLWHRGGSPSFHPAFSLLRFDSHPSLIPSIFLFAPAWQPSMIPHSIHLRLFCYGMQSWVPYSIHLFLFSAMAAKHKLQALVFDILPSTTAVFSYAIGPRTWNSANEQFFVGAQIIPDVCFKL